jgi:hypothetical protein
MMVGGQVKKLEHSGWLKIRVLLMLHTIFIGDDGV